MERQAFFERIGRGEIAPCYVLEGPEEFVKRSALAALRKRLLPAGLEEMNEARLTDPDAQTLIAAAETLPLMAGRRLVVVRECGMLQGRARGYDEAASAAALSEYLQRPPESACIVFYVQGKADGRKKLYQSLKKAAEIVSFTPLDERELTRWIAQTLKRLNQRISVAACQKLAFTAGTDLDVLSGELEKLAAYAGERGEVTEEDIEAVCVRTTAWRVYDLAGALLRGEGRRAFELAEGLQRDGEEGLGLLALLQSECRRVLAVKVLRGLPGDEIARQIGAPPFAVRQLSATAARYTTAQLRAMCDCCMDCEYRVKSGRLPVEGALEETMLQLLRIGAEGQA